MEKLRKLSFVTMAVAIVIVIYVFVTANYSVSSPNETPQDVMKELNEAVVSADESKIASLFVDNDSYQEFLNVPKNTHVSKMGASAIKRNTDQSSLKSWQLWFLNNSVDSLIYVTNTSGIHCTDKTDSFVIGFTYVKGGYLINHCGYSL